MDPAKVAALTGILCFPPVETALVRATPNYNCGSVCDTTGGGRQCWDSFGLRCGVRGHNPTVRRHRRRVDYRESRLPPREQRRKSARRTAAVEVSTGGVLEGASVGHTATDGPARSGQSTAVVGAHAGTVEEEGALWVTQRAQLGDVVWDRRGLSRGVRVRRRWQRGPLRVRRRRRRWFRQTFLGQSRGP